MLETTRIDAILAQSPIMPVIAIKDTNRACELADALMEGGISVLEITLRTPKALEAIERIAKNVPGAVVGAGTVLNPRDLQAVRDAGAQFAISPGITPPLLQAGRESTIPLLPGVATASEIMAGLSHGYSRFKLFPATVAGGIAALKAFGGPFAQVRFCPTGGIGEENFIDFFKLSNVACIGGSWVAPASLIDAGSWDAITRIARRSVDKISAAKD